MPARTWTRLIIVALLSVASVVAYPVTALGSVGCDLSAGTLTVTLNADGEATRIGESSGGEIRVLDSSSTPITCTGTTPTDANTDLINVGVSGEGADGSGSDQQTATIDLNPDGFIGSATTANEIEIAIDLGTGTSDSLAILGSDNPATIYIGTSGVILDDNGGFDITFSNVESSTITGGDSADNIDAISLGQAISMPLTLDGGGGDDILTGNNGDDVLIGNSGNDVLDGGGGFDTLNGDGGDDAITGGPGGDTINGGESTIGIGDSVSYFASAEGVTVDISDAGPEVGGDAAGDTLSGIEHLLGSPNDDTLTGDDNGNIFGSDQGNDTLNGGGGDDLFEQGASFVFAEQGLETDGADTIDGGPGEFDTVDYELRGTPVTVDRDGVADDGHPTAKGGVGEGDNVQATVENLNLGPLPNCGGSVTEDCVVSFQTDPDGDGVGFGPPHANLYLAWSNNLFDDGATSAEFMGIVALCDTGRDIRDCGMTKDSLVRFEVDTGALDPMTQFSLGPIESIVTGTDSEGDNRLEMETEVGAASRRVLDCFVGSCGDDTTVADFDYQGVEVTATEVTSTDPDSADFVAAIDGSYAATNAQDWGPPTQNDDGSIQIQVAAPHFKEDGTTVNTGFFEMFLTDEMLELMNIDSARAVGSGDMAATQTSEGSTRTLRLTVMPVNGGLLIDAPLITYSSPTIRVRARDSDGDGIPDASEPCPTADVCGSDGVDFVTLIPSDDVDGDGVIEVRLGAGNDVVTGSGSADIVYGGGGADRLSGRGGKDRLYGQGGNDVLSGGSGNDRLVGEGGSDRLRGGGGVDRCDKDRRDKERSACER